jgi:SAM-dependent methyltransferase
MANDDSPEEKQPANAKSFKFKPNGSPPGDASEPQPIADVHKITTPDGRDVSRLYDEDYYQTCCGPIPYGRSEPWLAFFSNVAEHVIRSLQPRKVLDAGCAMGLLVESLWDRGVEAWGIDISPYAISQVRRDVKPFCTLGSITDPIDAQFDLVVCLEVIEHIPAEYEREVVGNLCSAAKTILFSSTPTDISEATHFNVRPTIYWLKLFSEFGFRPDLLYDASFVAPHAMLLKKSEHQLPDEVLSLFAETIRQKLALRDRDNRVRPLEQDLEKSRIQLAESLERQTALNIQLASLTARLDEERVQLNEALKERKELDRKLDSASAQLHTLSEKADISETSFREETTGLKRKLNLANQQLNEIFASPGWKVIRRYRGWVAKARRAHPRLFGRYERVTLWMLRLAAGQPDQQRSLPEMGLVSDNSSLDRGESSEAVTEPHIRSEKYSSEDTSKFLLIISGCPGDAHRYRADHQAEELRLLGLTVDTVLFDAVDYDCVLRQYSAFVLHRVPETTFVAHFIKRAKRSGRPVIFDTDDLVFNEKFIRDIKAIAIFRRTNITSTSTA